MSDLALILLGLLLLLSALVGLGSRLGYLILRDLDDSPEETPSDRIADRVD